MSEENSNQRSIKNEVEEYIKKHKFEEYLNMAINRIVMDRPEDPYMTLAVLLTAESKASNAIISIEGRKIYDSKGEATLQINLTTTHGVFTSSVPSYVPGYKDEGEKYQGNVLEKVIDTIQEKLQPLLENLNPKNQNDIDILLSNDDLEKTIGRNAILATSIAVCKAGANAVNTSLYQHIANLADIEQENILIPIPYFSLINGGKYASSNLNLQDIMIIPINAKCFEEALELGLDIQQNLQNLLEAKGIGFTNRGSIGGFSALIQDEEEALEIVNEAILLTIKKKEGNINIKLAIDIAADEIVFRDKTEKKEERNMFFYNILKTSKKAPTSSDDLLLILKEWFNKYKVLTMINPFAKEDISSFQRLQSDMKKLQLEAANPKVQALKSNTSIDISNSCFQIVGNQIVDPDACNAIFLNLFEHKTVSEAIALATEARRLSLEIISGCSTNETEDTFLTDFTIGIGASQVRIGGLCHCEQMIKYNRLLEISNEINAPPYNDQIFQVENR